jgi:predicted small secreted protein
MKSSLKTCAALLAASAVLAGCAGTPVNFAGRSVTDRSQIDPAQGRKIMAKASGFQLLLLIPIKVNGRQQEAYQALLEQAGDSMLSDITITESWSYAFVGTVYTTTIEATAYPKPAAAAK